MLGINEEEADGWIGRKEEPDGFLVWPENWQTVKVFLAMETQWDKVAGPLSVRYEGLKYHSLQAVYDGLGVRKKDIPDVFAGIRIMERAALEVIRKLESDEEDEDVAAA